MRLIEAYRLLGYSGPNVRGHAARAVTIHTPVPQYVIALTPSRVSPDRRVATAHPTQIAWAWLTVGETVKAVLMDGDYPGDRCEALPLEYRVIEKTEDGFVVLLATET